MSVGQVGLYQDLCVYGLISKNVFKILNGIYLSSSKKNFCYCQLRFLIYSGVCLLILKADSIVINTEINFKMFHILDSQKKYSIA